MFRVALTLFQRLPLANTRTKRSAGLLLADRRLSPIPADAGDYLINAISASIASFVILTSIAAMSASEPVS